MAVVSYRRKYTELTTMRDMSRLPPYMEWHPQDESLSWVHGLWIRWVGKGSPEKPFKVRGRAGTFLYAMVEGGKDGNLLVAIYKDDPLRIVVYDERLLRFMKIIAEDFEKEFGWEVAVEVRKLVAIQI